ncbi:MAG TPA: TMEM175 family protein [Candidatus Nitrosocosmicus sp.]|jgi:uncharacterized membrane protein
MNLSSIKVDYVISFSDALFAFAITLMALSIEIPNFPNNISESELTKRLGELLVPNINHYIISFLVVGMYWIAYHRIFEYIKRVDYGLLWLNLLFLFFISLVAYFTGLLTTYDTYRVVVIVFASVISIAGLILCAMWLYATHNRRLVDKDMHPYLVRYFFIRGITSPVIFMTSIGISFIDVQLTYYFWFIMIPVYGIIDKIHKPSLSRL